MDQGAQRDQPKRVFNRSHDEEIELALSAIDCVLNDEKAVYASSELTTGRRVNSVLRDAGVRRSAELRRMLGGREYETRIWNPNVASAMAFGTKLRNALGGRQLVITPAPFAAPEWTQFEYLAFWELLIRTRISAVYFNDGWEYSNGCTFEFLVALDKGLPTYDAEGKPVSAAKGSMLIRSAIDDLSKEGWEFDTLAGHLERLSHAG